MLKHRKSTDQKILFLAVSPDSSLIVFFVELYWLLKEMRLHKCSAVGYTLILDLNVDMQQHMQIAKLRTYHKFKTETKRERKNTWEHQLITLTSG